MTQIILIEPEESLRSILKLNIMKALGCNVIEKESASDAINLMEIIPNIDLIICREKVELENKGADTRNFF